MSDSKIAILCDAPGADQFPLFNRIVSVLQSQEYAVETFHDVDAAKQRMMSLTEEEKPNVLVVTNAISVAPEGRRGADILNLAGTLNIPAVRYSKAGLSKVTTNPKAVFYEYVSGLDEKEFKTAIETAIRNVSQSNQVSEEPGTVAQGGEHVKKLHSPGRVFLGV